MFAVWDDHETINDSGASWSYWTVTSANRPGYPTLARAARDAADWEADLPVEQSGGPRVDARHVAELVVLVQHDRRPLLRGVGEHPGHARSRRLELRDDLAPRLGVERVAILHDEARRDLSPEAGLRAPLPLDLLEQSARRFVGRLALEHRPQIHDGLRRVVAAVVKMGE